MNLFLFIACLGGLFIVLEGIFFLYCFRWLSSGKKEREKDFVRLDKDRAELISLQSSIANTLQESKLLAKDTLAQLNRIGAEANAEWNDMFSKMNRLMSEVENHSQQISQSAHDAFHKSRIKTEKLMQDSQRICTLLEEKTTAAKKVLQLLDETAPQELILSEIQEDKYQRARHLISQGMETTEISQN